jgi:hypothetical protein
MNTVNPAQAILDGGLFEINFFNGRLLSGEDLTQEQAVHRARTERLGQAVGEGVAWGLQVSAPRLLDNTSEGLILHIHAGLAVNRRGQTLLLPADQDLALVVPSSNGTTGGTGLFTVCDSSAGIYTGGAGLYLLTLAPAEGSQGRAPTSGLGNTTATCNTRYLVEGVCFHLIPLVLPTLPDAAHLRNELAYRCFGQTDLNPTLANPFGPSLSKYGLLDTLRPNPLTDGEVPLAILNRSANGIEFVDMWSVRRRITAPTAVEPWLARSGGAGALPHSWHIFLSDRRKSEAEAVFLQFQEQIQDIIRDETNLTAITAADRFSSLPPAGLLPITSENSPGGFNWQTFFGNLAPAQLDITDAALLRSLICESLDHEPFPIANTSSGKLVLYLIRENVDSVQAGTGSQLVVAFARPGLFYRGASRFDYARWDIARFSV